MTLALRRILADVDELPREITSSQRALADRIYTRHYLGETGPRTRARFEDAVTAIVLREDPQLGAALRAANRGTGWVDDGWRTVGARAGAAVVRKDRISLLASEGDLAARNSDGTVHVRFPNERPYAYPDYYVAIGNGGPPGPSDGPLIRLYFHVAAASAPALLSAITGTMGATLRRFAFKILNHPDSYGRPDAAVALVPRDEIGRALSLLGAGIEGVALNDVVPAFTLRLGHGVALAEDPADDGLSFGQHRAVIIARALVRAVERGADVEARFDAVVDELADAGIDATRPYCRRDSLEQLHAEIDRHLGTR